MKEPEMFIVVRKDLNLKRRDVASLVAQASMQFIVENDDDDRTLHCNVNLTIDEAAWLRGRQKKVIVYADSEDEFESTIFRAKMHGVPVYTIPNIDGNKNCIAAAAFGPIENSNYIKKLTDAMHSI